MVKKLLIVLLSAALAFILAEHDAFLYQQPIGKIVSVTNNSSSAALTDNFANQDQQITQNLTIQLLNQSRTKIKIITSSTRSQTTTLIYYVGQQVLLTPQNGTYSILTIKRDSIVLALFALFLGLLICFVQLKAASLLLLSLAANLLYFLIALALNLTSNTPMLLIFSGLSIVFVASSCVFVLGRNRQSLWTLISTGATTTLIFALVAIVLLTTGNSGIHFEYLDVATTDPSSLFFASTLISVLGAIMDACSDIVVGLFGIYRQNPRTSRYQLFSSGRHIGQEIVGTLTGVLLMIFMAESLPMTLLLLRNGNNWSTILTTGLNLGLFQTLISALGIILAIPLASALSALALTRKEAPFYE